VGRRRSYIQLEGGRTAALRFSCRDYIIRYKSIFKGHALHYNYNVLIRVGQRLLQRFGATTNLIVITQIRNRTHPAEIVKPRLCRTRVGSFCNSLVTDNAIYCRAKSILNQLNCQICGASLFCLYLTGMGLAVVGMVLGEIHCSLVYCSLGS